MRYLTTTVRLPFDLSWKFRARMLEDGYSILPRAFQLALSVEPFESEMAHKKNEDVIGGAIRPIVVENVRDRASHLGMSASKLVRLAMEKEVEGWEPARETVAEVRHQKKAALRKHKKRTAKVEENHLARFEGVTDAERKRVVDEALAKMGRRP